VQVCSSGHTRFVIALTSRKQMRMHATTAMQAESPSICSTWTVQARLIPGDVPTVMVAAFGITDSECACVCANMYVQLLQLPQVHGSAGSSHVALLMKCYDVMLACLVRYVDERTVCGVQHDTCSTPARGALPPTNMYQQKRCWCKHLVH
jgi:hypothetical protein